MFGFTVTVNVAGNAHRPALGVNVYMAEAELLTMAGFHVPVIPLVDVLGNAGTGPPAQMVSDTPKVNVGVMFGSMVTVNVTGIAHSPAAGVNVYVPDVELLTTAGLHAPVIPLLEVVGKVGTDPPAQILSDVPKANIGVMLGLTVTANVTGSAH